MIYYIYHKNNKYANMKYEYSFIIRHFLFAELIFILVSMRYTKFVHLSVIIQKRLQQIHYKFQHMGKCESILLRQGAELHDGRQNIIQTVLQRAALLNYIYECKSYYKSVSWGRYTYWDRYDKSKNIYNNWYLGVSDKQMKQVIKQIEKKVETAKSYVQGKLNQFIKRKGIKFRDDADQQRMFRQILGEKKALLALKQINQRARYDQQVEFYEVFVKPQIKKTIQQIKELETKLQYTSSLSYDRKKKLFNDIQSENQQQIKAQSEQQRKKCKQRLKFYQFYLKSHITDDQIKQVLKEFDQSFQVLEQTYKTQQQINQKCWYQL